GGLGRTACVDSRWLGLEKRPSTEGTLSVSATVLPGGKLHYARVGALGGTLFHPALSLRSRARLYKVMAAAWKHRRRFDWYHPERASPIDTESLRAWGERTVGRDAVDWLLSPTTSTLFFWNADETAWWQIGRGACREVMGT